MGDAADVAAGRLLDDDDDNDDDMGSSEDDEAVGENEVKRAKSCSPRTCSSASDMEAVAQRSAKDSMSDTVLPSSPHSSGTLPGWGKGNE